MNKSNHRLTQPTFRRALLAAAVSNALLASAASAATITVNSLLDNGDGANCTLREAIVSANSVSDPGNGCAHDGLSDTIVFDAGVTGTITLTGGQMAITSSMTIQGPGADQLTIDAAGNSRHFEVNDSSFATSQTATISDLRLTNGALEFYGGAIYNREALTLQRVHLEGNTVGPAIGRGGAVWNTNVLDIVDSTLSGNLAQYGGGVFNNDSATVTLAGSTLRNNRSDIYGGGIHNYNGTATVTNSTLSGNSSNRGGGMHNDGIATLNHVTLAYNSGSYGGGLYTLSSTATLNNSIIAGSNGPDCAGSGTTTINTSLIEDGSCSPSFSGDPQLGNLANNGGPTQTHALRVGSPAIGVADAALCAATDQRGQVRDSAACDLGAFQVTPSIVVNTLADTTSDDGSCSLREAVATVTTGVASGAAAGECNTAPATPADAIEFDPALFNGSPATLTLSSGQIALDTAAVSIQGPSDQQLIIDANNQSRHFAVGESQASVAVTIASLTLTNGNAGTAAGGAVYVLRGDVDLNQVTLTGNTAAYGGGAYTQLGDLSFENSTLSGNTAMDGGGGLANGLGIIDTVNSTIASNSAGASGGGGVLNLAGGGTITLTNTLIADSIGGDCAGSDVVLTESLIEDGSCASPLSGDALLGPLSNNGGPTPTHAFAAGSPALNAGDNALCPATDQRGIGRDATCDIGAFELLAEESAPIVVTTLVDSTANDGTCSLREAIVSANSDTASGTSLGECEAGFGEDTIEFDPALALPGTITLVDGQMTIDSALTLQGPGADQLTIDADLASRHFSIGGASIDTAVTINALTLSNGYVSGSERGGSIYNQLTLTLNDSILSDNTAHDGGGISIVFGGPLTLNDSVLSGNSAGERGGGIFSEYAIANFTNSILINNGATSHGGGIHSYGGTLNLTRSTLSENTAGDNGGGINNYGATANLTNSTLSGNIAGSYGGGISNRPGYDLYEFALANLSNSTLSGNSAGVLGGGIHNASAAEANLANSIIANSPGGGDCTGNFIFTTNSLIQDGSCAPQFSGDPQLGPLADNGGPTQTHAVLSGSPVIDAGDQTECDSAGLATDQTGMPRPIDGDADGTATCDLGAFEFVDMFAPVANLSSAPNVLAPGATEHVVVVTYADADGAVDAGSFDIADIRVSPGPLVVAAVSIAGDSVSYTLTPPGGNWDATDNGSYTIAVNANQVFDIADPTPNAVVAGNLGNFSVAIADINVLGNGVSITDGDTTPDPADDTDFGTITTDETRSRTFTIRNAGEGTINLTGTVTITGAGFSISAQPTDTALTAGESTTFEVTFDPAAEGPAAGTVTIANDDPDENPYTFAVAGNAVVPVMPDIDVLGNGVSIVDGDTTPDSADDTDFGQIAAGASLTRTFSIRNTGAGTINLAAPVVVLGVGFSLSAQPIDTALAAGESTSFDLRFSPLVSGNATGTITILSDDPDENPYTFAVIGEGVISNGAPVANDAMFTVLDSADIGSLVGQVQATDPDDNIPGSGAWQITAGNGSGAYAIDDDGRITVADSAELQDTALTVQVTDDAGLSDTASVTITVVGDAIFSNGFE